MHGVKRDRSVVACCDEPWQEFGRTVDPELLCCENRDTGKASDAEFVIWRTGIRQIAVSRRLVHGDRSLDHWAAQAHAASVDHTLLTALDLPWVPDGLQRDSEEVRQTVHEQVVQVLQEREIPYLLVSGSLQQRMLQVECLIGPA